MRWGHGSVAAGGEGGARAAAGPPAAHQLAPDKRSPGRVQTMTKRELAICCAILERRGLRYRLQPWSSDGQAGVDLWFFTPGGIPIEVHAGSMWGFWTFLNLGKGTAVGARKQHQYVLMEDDV